MGVLGRFEYKFSGDWSDFDSFTSSPGDEEAIMVGAAVMGQKYGEAVKQRQRWWRQSGLDGTTVLGFTGDVSAKFGGFSLFGSFVYQSYDFGDGFGPNSITGTHGVLLSRPVTRSTTSGNSSLVTKKATVTVTSANALNVGAEGGNPSIITVGANYFINDNVKFTVDWGINLADNMSIFAGNESDTGWTSSDSSDQWVLRAQLQLLF